MQVFSHPILTCTGHAAPSPRAQMVWPSICLLSSQIMSISAGRASPRTKRHIILFIQSTPEHRTPKEKSVRREMKAEEADTGRAFTLSARRALATALVFVELNQTCDGSDDISLKKNKPLLHVKGVCWWL